MKATPPRDCAALCFPLIVLGGMIHWHARPDEPPRPTITRPDPIDAPDALWKIPPLDYGEPISEPSWFVSERYWFDLRPPASAERFAWKEGAEL